jgi:HTH-type transcriptional regulator, competence development regulator
MSPKRLKTVIKRLRQEKGLSQQALAARVGVTAAYITMLERGKKTNPSLDILKKLAKALGVPVTELLG